MNRLLLFVTCVTAISCLQLNNICKEDVFDFQSSKNAKAGIPVNAFYRLRLDKKLPKIKEFYLSNTMPPKFKDPNNYGRLKEIQMEYDGLLLDVYSTTFMKNLKNENVISKQKDYADLENQLREIIDWGKGFDDNVTDWRNFYYQKMRKTETLLKNLSSAKRETLTEYFVQPSELEQMLSDLVVEQQQESCFQGIFSYVYYSKPVMEVAGMSLHRASKIFFSPESNGTIHFDLVIPFNNLNHDQDLKSGACTKAAELPAFYRNKDNS